MWPKPKKGGKNQAIHNILSYRHIFEEQVWLRVNYWISLSHGFLISECKAPDIADVEITEGHK